jgi:hypothetical protein
VEHEMNSPDLERVEHTREVAGVSLDRVVEVIRLVGASEAGHVRCQRACERAHLLE